MQETQIELLKSRWKILNIKSILLFFSFVKCLNFSLLIKEEGGNNFLAPFKGT